ncbi:MAG: hypothetical protein ACPGU7_01060 [Gammaproteobacteria bacterium]
MLAYGPGGESFGGIMGAMKRLDCPDDIGRLALFIAGLCTARELRSWWSRKGYGNARGKVFTINVDTDLLASPLLRLAMDRFLDQAAPICVEVNEDVQADGVGEFKDLAVDYREELTLALDDAHEMDDIVRLRLESTVAIAKVSNKKAAKLFALRGENPDYVLRQMANVRVPGKPTIVEGIEDPGHLRFLENHWNTDTHGTLWVQGYHLAPADQWREILTPLSADPMKPEAFVLPVSSTDSTAEAVRTGDEAPPPKAEPITRVSQAVEPPLEPEEGSYVRTLRLSHRDLNLLTRILGQLPTFADPAERRAAVEDAVGGFAMSRVLLSQIDLSGKPGVVAHEVVVRFAGFELEPEVDALITLIKAFSRKAAEPERSELEHWLRSNGVACR